MLEFVEHSGIVGVVAMLLLQAIGGIVGGVVVVALIRQSIKTHDKRLDKHDDRLDSLERTRLEASVFDDRWRDLNLSVKALDAAFGLLQVKIAGDYLAIPAFERAEEAARLARLEMKTDLLKAIDDLGKRFDRLQTRPA